MNEPKLTFTDSYGKVKWIRLGPAIELELPDCFKVGEAPRGVSRITDIDYENKIATMEWIPDG